MNVNSLHASIPLLAGLSQPPFLPFSFTAMQAAFLDSNVLWKNASATSQRAYLATQIDSTVPRGTANWLSWKIPE